MAKYRRPSAEFAPGHAKVAGLYIICGIEKDRALKAGFDDALMLDWKGDLAESTGANIFLVIDGKLVTPTPENFLDGITRRAVMGMARKRGWAVEERTVRPRGARQGQRGIPVRHGCRDRAGGLDRRAPLPGGPCRPHPDGGFPEAGARARLRRLRRGDPSHSEGRWRLDSRGALYFASMTSEGCPVSAEESGLRQPMGLNPLNLIRVMPAKEREFIEWPNPSVIVVGAGVAGLACALELAERGVAVEVVERGRALGDGSCSWMAGGMLAPWCERATTDPEIATWGAPSIAWWAERFPGTVQNGSLVVAQARDAPDLARFAERTERFEWADAERIAALEPDLAGRFRRALFFPDEAHLDPRRALPALAETLKGRGVAVRFGIELMPEAADADIVVDCRGLAARDALPDLRGVRGEMIVVRSRDVSLARPVRMLHPRLPLYIVPRGDGLFMIGATMIESERARAGQRALRRRASERGLCAASGVRRGRNRRAGRRSAPGFPDNLPQMRRTAACCTPTACSVTASCWRRRLPAGWRMPSSIPHSGDSRCGSSSTTTSMTSSPAPWPRRSNRWASAAARSRPR